MALPTQLVSLWRVVAWAGGRCARAHLAEAGQIATRIGERNGLRMHFGPTNVAIWRLGIGIELGEGGRAYEPNHPHAARPHPAPKATLTATHP